MEIERGNTSCLYLHVLINTDPKNNKLNSSHSEGLKHSRFGWGLWKTCTLWRAGRSGTFLFFLKLAAMGGRSRALRCRGCGHGQLSWLCCGQGQPCRGSAVPWGLGCAGRAGTGGWAPVPGVSQGLSAARALQLRLQEGGSCWTRGCAGAAGLHLQFEGSVCGSRAGFAGRRNFWLPVFSSKGTASAWCWWSEGARRALALAGGSEFLLEDPPCCSRATGLGLWEAWGLDFSGKESGQIQGKFCIVPLESFTMETWTCWGVQHVVCTPDCPAHPQVHRYPQHQGDQREIISELGIKPGFWSACASESCMLLFVRMRVKISFNELNLENGPCHGWLKCGLSAEGMRIFCFFSGVFFSYLEGNQFSSRNYVIKYQNLFIRRSKIYDEAGLTLIKSFSAPCIYKL